MMCDYDSINMRSVAFPSAILVGLCGSELGLFVPDDICVEIEKHVGIWDGSYTSDEVYEICAKNPGKLRCVQRNTYGPYLYNFPRMGVLSYTFHRDRRYRVRFSVQPLGDRSKSKRPELSPSSSSRTTAPSSGSNGTTTSSSSSSGSNSNPTPQRSFVGVIGDNSTLSELGFANWRVQYSVDIASTSVTSREEHVLDIDVRHPEVENKSRSRTRVLMTHNGVAMEPCNVHGRAVRLAAEATSECEISIDGIEEIRSVEEQLFLHCM